jgi:hypothetical protein
MVTLTSGVGVTEGVVEMVGVYDLVAVLVLEKDTVKEMEAVAVGVVKQNPNLHTHQARVAQR